MNAQMDAKHTLLMSRIGESEPAELVMTLLATARRIDAACAEILGRFDLSEGRFAVLLAVEKSPGLSPAEVAAGVGVTRATVTGLVDGLSRSGLVSRRTDGADRRSLSLRLTPAGKALLAELVPQYRTWLSVLVDGIAPTERAVATTVLTGLQRNLTVGDPV